VNRPDAARIDALHQLAVLQPPKALELCRSLFPGGATPRVLAAARTTIMKLDAAASYLQIHEALANGSPEEMQATLLMAQRFNSKQSDTFWLEAGRKLYLAKIPPPARLEVIEALLLRDNQPRSKWRRLLEVIEADSSEEADPLARWRMCETGGDPDKGRLLFETSRHAACMSCHALHGRGGTSAPELEGIGKKKRAPDLLAALLHPSDSVVQGYGHVTVTLKSGAQHRGQLRRRGETLTLETPRGTLQLPAAEVKSVSTPESPMPATGSLLTPRELRDLVAFLSGL
jgi:quinoprotein glucose dehydrogenase